VVLDTNVVISALLFRGVAAALVPAWQEQRMRFLVSKPLLEEYSRVLHYPKFRLDEGEIRGLIQEELLPFVTPVTVTKTPRVIKEDPTDDHIIACAVAGRADVIATGDSHLLRLQRYHGIAIVTIPILLHRLNV